MTYKIIRISHGREEVMATCDREIDATECLSALNNLSIDLNRADVWQYKIVKQEKAGLSREDIIEAALDKLEECSDAPVFSFHRSEAFPVLDLLVDRARDLQEAS
jgi:hypothetical protein